MKHLPNIIEQAKPDIARLASKYRVSKLFAFGSVTNERFSNGSDLDFLVQFGDIPLLEYADNYFELQEELEQLFGRKVDLVVDKSVKNRYLARSIEESKVPLYG